MIEIMDQLYKVCKMYLRPNMTFALMNMHISVPRNRLFEVNMKIMKNTQSLF